MVSLEDHHVLELSITQQANTTAKKCVVKRDKNRQIDINCLHLIGKYDNIFQ